MEIQGNTHNRLLWHLYGKSITNTKRFRDEDGGIPEPRSKLRYNWHITRGFFLWLGQDLPLKYLWITAAVSAVLAIFIALKAPSHQIAVNLSLPFFLILLMSLIAAGDISIYRAIRWLKTKPKLENALAAVFGIAVLGVLIGSMLTSDSQFAEFWKDMKYWFKWYAIVMICALTLGTLLKIWVRVSPNSFMWIVKRAIGFGKGVKRLWQKIF